MPWSDQCGKVMKKPDEYSKNPNTVRARARKARLDPYRRELEQGKAGDRKAISRAWKIRIESDDYKMASPEARKMILQGVERDVMDRRRQRGYDAESRMERFLRQHGSNASNTPNNTQTDEKDTSPATKTGGNYEQMMNRSTPTLSDHHHAQPLTALHLTSFGGQDGSKSSSISSDPYQAVPAIEAAHHQYFRNGIQMSAVAPPQNEYSYEPSSRDHDYMAQLPFKLKEYEHKISQLESTIQRLTYDLAMTNHAMAIQGKSVRDMENLLRLHSFTNPTAHGNNVEPPEPAQPTGKLWTLANGVQMLAQVAADSYPSPASGSNDKVRPDDSNTIKDEPTESIPDLQDGYYVMGDHMKVDTASIVDAHLGYGFQDGTAADETTSEKMA